MNGKRRVLSFFNFSRHLYSAFDLKVAALFAPKVRAKFVLGAFVFALTRFHLGDGFIGILDELVLFTRQRGQVGRLSPASLLASRRVSSHADGRTDGQTEKKNAKLHLRLTV